MLFNSSPQQILLCRLPRASACPRSLLRIHEAILGRGRFVDHLQIHQLLP
jgi:hypothetical protein